MDEIVVRLKSGEEIIYPHPATAEWKAIPNAVIVITNGSQAVDIYNANEVVFVIHREKRHQKLRRNRKNEIR